jgi:hypothetical protein
VNDSTADLTDERLAAAADEAWNRANMCLDGGLPDRRAAALRAVAALARQGWAPAPDAPDHVADSSESLSREIWGLIGESDGVYGLHKNGDPAPWDKLLPGGGYERLSSLPPFDDTASDHIADVSNMVESAPDTVYSERFNPTQCNQ